MSELSLFFSAGIEDQLSVAGSPCTLKNPGDSTVYSFTGILSESSGALSAEVGLMEHAVTAHLLIPVSVPFVPLASALVAANGKRYSVVGVAKSPTSAAYSCDLQALSK